MNCEICHNTTNPHKRLAKFILYKCELCGFMQFDYQYAQELFERVNSKILSNPSKHNLSIVKHFEKYFIDKNILDVGSGVARFQQAMDISEIKYKTYVNVDNMAVGKKEYHIINGDITTRDFIDKLPIDQYDTIIASHCLEHLPYPSRVLNIWQSLLSKEGIIYVEVPSYYDTSGWLRCEHISYFDENSLEKLMEKYFIKIDAGRMRKNIYYIGGKK